MTTIRSFRPADAAAVAALIARCLREVNSRDYPPDLIDRMCAHFTPERMIELSGIREIFVATSTARAAEPLSESPPRPDSRPAPEPHAPPASESVFRPAAEPASGTVLGTVSRDGNKVFTMFVDPRAHGQGIGRKLMTHIEGLAEADGFDHMETGASISAHDFYRRLGYSDVRVSETDFGLNYILRKPLA
ncbi:GCN5 family acetyltransferase [Actinoplanes sp. SE50/110]|nr:MULTISPECIES: GNAT family N-acetyltransferase [unclassified Actinoplanes]SLM01703.1 GCN5 family acetyltransferase [Actinoplanes sp. SE50/110]